MRKPKRGSLEPNQNSIVINIIPVLESRGVKFPTAFLKKLGLSSTSIMKLLQGDARQINLIQLTKICVALKCEPNDLFELRDMELPVHHPLNNLRKVRPASEIMSMEEFLGKKSVMEVRGMLRR